MERVPRRVLEMTAGRVPRDGSLGDQLATRRLGRDAIRRETGTKPIFAEVMAAGGLPMKFCPYHDVADDSVLLLQRPDLTAGE